MGEQRSASPRFDIEVTADEAELARFIPTVTAAVETALSEEGSPPGSAVAIVLTTDPVIAEYHARYMGIEGSTDVLSWPSGEPALDTPVFLGDVMVSCDTARVQAEALGHNWAREVCVLAVHGTLHLLGWDDRTEEDRQSMQTRVDAIVDAALASPPR